MNKTFFTPENLEAMRELNARIALFQHNILKEAVVFDAQLQKRVADEKDWLVDYEMEARIAFYLKASDPAYDEESDNLLVVHNEYLKGIADEDAESAWRWSGNHNEFFAWNHPMRGEYHCWWFHHLYDHTHLEWEDLLRIGHIWGDVKVWYQYEDRLTCKNNKNKPKQESVYENYRISNRWLFIKQRLKNSVLSECKAKDTLLDVLFVIKRLFHKTPISLKTSVDKETVYYRELALYLLVNFSNATYEEIAKEFGVDLGYLKKFEDKNHYETKYGLQLELYFQQKIMAYAQDRGCSILFYETMSEEKFEVLAEKIIELGLDSP